MDQEFVSRIARHVERLVSIATVLLPEKDQWRKGGGLAIFEELVAPTFSQVYLVEIGEPLPEKRPRYRFFSVEKVLRLCEHLEHRTSRESRDEALEHWGGAIRVGRLILSFSGFPEIWDEALMLNVAVNFRFLSIEDAGKIASPEVMDSFYRLMAITP